MLVNKHILVDGTDDKTMVLMIMIMVIMVMMMIVFLTYMNDEDV